MGKGFHNFMSKKDFHPSAIWNLKKVWMAQQKVDEDKVKQEAMRVQYDKEQELINNKALLGDEKARLGLAFMYEPPTGLRKEEDDAELKTEPKFEWQRKYNAPRESWAKGDENVMDQPFGIMVRNVRCVKCHKWGHTNTDRECPLFNMTGNYDDPGICNNPSELIKELRKGQEDLNEKKAAMRDRLPTRFLNEHMKSEYGLSLRKNVIGSFTTDEKLAVIARRNDKHEEEEEPSSSKSESKKSRKRDKSPKKDDPDQMASFLTSLSEKEKAKIFKKFFSMQHGGEAEKKSKKKSKKKSHRDHESRKRKRSDSDSSDNTSSDSEGSPVAVRGKQPQEKSGGHRRIRSRSPSPKRNLSRRHEEERERNKADGRDKRRRQSSSRSRSRDVSSRHRSEYKRRH